MPDAHVTYLGGVERHEGTEGLIEAPAATATAILFSGGFSFGASGLLRSALDAAPQVQLVAFESPGGRPLVAEQVATHIRMERRWFVRSGNRRAVAGGGAPACGVGPDGGPNADTAVRTTIEAQYGKHALSNAATPEHAFDDPAKSCAVSIAYLRGLRDRPEGPGVLRWALAAG